MKNFSTRLIFAAAMSCIAMSAAATGLHGSTGSNGSNGAGGGGGGGGGGAAALGVGIAASQAQAAAINTNQIGIANHVGLSMTGGATSATAAGGLGGTGIGGAASASGGSIGSGAVSVTTGGTTYRAAAAPSFAPPASGPISSCRLFMGAGGATVKGSLSGGIPIGNDQACVVESSHEMMNRINAMAPNSFSKDDYLRPVCKFEGMSETKACQDLEGRSTASAPPAMAYTPN